VDRSIENDLEQLQGGPEPDSIYKCPNLQCQWRGTEPLNTQSNRGGRKVLEIRCPECTVWIRPGFSQQGSDIVLWPPADRGQVRTLETENPATRGSEDALDGEFTQIDQEDALWPSSA